MNERKLRQQFFRYILPGIAGEIGMSCYILADTFFISKGMGADGITALNLALPVFNLQFGLGILFGIGGATRFSILNAQGQTNKGREFFRTSLLTGLAAGLFLLICGLFFASEIAELLGADIQVKDITVSYIRTVLLFSPMFVCNRILSAFVRNDKEPALAMTAQFIGCISNIGMDYLLIFVCDLGMFGAALATGCSPMISILLLLFHFAKRRSEEKKTVLTFEDIAGSILPDKTQAFFKGFGERLLCSVPLGTSAFITELSAGIVILAFNYSILGITGNEGVAAFGIVANLALVVASLYTGLSSGIQPLISDAYGSGETKKSEKLVGMGIRTSLIMAAVLYFIIFTFADNITAVFNSEGNARLALMAREGLRIYFTAYLFAGLNMVFASAFSAREEAGKGFAVSLLRGFVFIVPIVVLMSRLFGMRGVWLSYPTAEALTCAAAVGMYVAAGKKKKEE